jgi:hypothetical protein
MDFHVSKVRERGEVLTMLLVYVAGRAMANQYTNPSKNCRPLPFTYSSRKEKSVSVGTFLM